MKKLVPVLSVLGSFVIACGSAPGGTSPGSDAERVGATASSETAIDPVSESPAAAGEVTRVSFVPALGCAGLEGTWRGQVYSPPHGGYYDFTVEIAQPDPLRPELSGSMVARSWQGETEDVAPPETCEGRYHWTVLEEAAGEVAADGSVRFGATSWRVGEHFCGDAVTDYSPDQLALTRPTGDQGEVTRMNGVLTDAVVWANEGLPVELTRVACH